MDYWVSFRIADDLTRSDRYSALSQSVEEYCGNVWQETTSFYLADSYLTIDALGKQLTKKLNPKKDILIIRMLNSKNARYFGAVEDLDLLEAFLPKIKSL
tara:strand:- start:188 stop:487 length:300 start_codon:yes stop_codon:yes gene_type:complete